MRWKRKALSRVIIGVFSDAPSQVAQEVHPCLVYLFNTPDGSKQ